MGGSHLARQECGLLASVLQAASLALAEGDRVVVRRPPAIDEVRRAGPFRYHT